MAFTSWTSSGVSLRMCAALALAVLGVFARLAAVQLTHSLTVLVDTSHALCRMIALVVCIFILRKCKQSSDDAAESKLRNTFGWARMEVLSLLVLHVLFASFGLALLMEALQNAAHSAHGDIPHAPQVQLAVGGGSLLLQAVNFLLLYDGPYPCQGNPAAKKGAENNERVSNIDDHARLLAYGFSDLLSSAFVLCAGATSFYLEEYTRLADSIICGIACIALVAVNSPGMRSAGLILLQTVPSGLETSALRAEVLRVGGVRALHELHVWQLAPGNIVATAHIYYESPEDFVKFSGDVTGVFAGRGISTVALQPEFGTERPPCAPACRAPRCCHPEPLPVQIPAQPGVPV